MREAVVFGGTNSLDFSEIRMGVIRIPDVSLRIEQAQKVWDKVCGTSFSFQHFLVADDNTFFSNINLKYLTLSVVQLGLLDRYARLFRKPEFIIGNTQNDSATLVAAGVITFEEMISSSRACHLLRPLSQLQPVEDLVLNGQTLPKFQVYEKKEVNGEQKFISSGTPELDLSKLLTELVDTHSVGKVVHIGPGALDKSQILNDFEVRDVQVLESIDMDPMLRWFWNDLMICMATA